MQSPGRTASLAVVLIFLKLVHEVAHGVACLHWGGRVKDCGVLFIVGVPLPYVNLSESCRFPSRWQRIATALAGVLMECLCAVFAILVWHFSESPYIDRLAADTVLAVAAGNPFFYF